MKNFPAITIHSDGGSRGNPGPAACAGLALSDEQVLFTVSKYLGITTNNQAEYQGLIEVLEQLNKQEYVAQSLTIKMDSELIIRQLEGRYKVKDQNLKTLYLQVQSLLNILKDSRFSKINLVHVPRSQNSQADSLVNKVLDEQ